MAQCFNNLTSSDAEHFFGYSTADWVVSLIVIPSISVFGIFCNLATILVVYRIKYMRTVTNVFLVSLAIADSSLLFVIVITNIWSFAVSPKYNLLGQTFDINFGCFMKNFLVYLFYYASLWIITMVSIERFIAVCRPLLHRRISSKRRAFRITVGSWFAAAVFASFSTPISVVWFCVVTPDGVIEEYVPICSSYCDVCFTLVNITDLIQFVVSLIINIAMYTLILVEVNKSPMPSIQTNDRANQVRNAVARMLMVNGVVFFICLFPYTIVNVYNIGMSFGWITSTGNWIYVYRHLATILYLSNSALNPVIYNVTNVRYRSAFKEAFGFRKEDVANTSFSLVQSSPTNLSRSAED